MGNVANRVQPWSARVSFEWYGARSVAAYFWYSTASHCCLTSNSIRNFTATVVNYVGKKNFYLCKPKKTWYNKKTKTNHSHSFQEQSCRKWNNETYWLTRFEWMRYFLSCLKSPVAVGELEVVSLPARVFLGAGLRKTASGRNEGGPLARLYRCVSFTLDIILLRLSHCQQKNVNTGNMMVKGGANIQRRLLCKKRPLNKGIGGPRKGDLIHESNGAWRFNSVVRTALVCFCCALMEAATRLLPERY